MARNTMLKALGSHVNDFTDEELVAALMLISVEVYNRDPNNALLNQAIIQHIKQNQPKSINKQ